MPAWLASVVDTSNRIALLDLAALAVVAIAAVVGAISSYTNDCLLATVGKRIGYDLRRLLYHHVQRMSLSSYEHRQTGDMVVRLTSDIDAAESFISSACWASCAT